MRGCGEGGERDMVGCVREYGEGTWQGWREGMIGARLRIERGAWER